MTIHQALTTGKQHLNSPTSHLDCELILCHILKQPKTFLITHSDDELTNEQQAHFDSLIRERANGKPIAYITHEKEFFKRSFFVDERVLIPRPETEEMVEDAIAYLNQHPEVQTIIDLGSGSGCIAITMAHEFPTRSVIGLEISAEALEVAKINQERFPCDNLQLLESNLLSNLPTTINQQPITILANLPYIGTETNAFVSDETKAYEPHQALFGGSDGLELYRQTWQQIKDKNLKLSSLFMEIGFSQAEKIEQEARNAFPEMHYELKNDLAGLPRTAVLKRAA